MPILIILLLIILVAGGTFCSGAFIYFIILKPFFKTAESRKLLLRCVIGFCVIAWGGAAILWYILKGPDFFEQGIDQLHKSQYIQNKVGDFNSYSYHPDKFPKDPTKKAIFQVTILGDSLHLFLTCTMNKVGDKWKLVKIKEDSVHKVMPE